MSIASEISRIAGNVADAFDAIEAKGVTVPVSSTSDNLATLIGLIAYAEDGNNLSYGLTDGTLPKAGVGRVGYAVV